MALLILPPAHPIRIGEVIQQVRNFFLFMTNIPAADFFCTIMNLLVSLIVLFQKLNQFKTTTTLKKGTT